MHLEKFHSTGFGNRISSESDRPLYKYDKLASIEHNWLLMSLGC